MSIFINREYLASCLCMCMCFTSSLQALKVLNLIHANCKNQTNNVFMCVPFHIRSRIVGLKQSLNEDFSHLSHSVNIPNTQTKVSAPQQPHTCPSRASVPWFYFCHWPQECAILDQIHNHTFCHLARYCSHTTRPLLPFLYCGRHLPLSPIRLRVRVQLNVTVSYCATNSVL